MYWGAGSQLGLLTCLGYVFFMAGALSMWRGREDVTTWLYSEVGVLRRDFSRYTTVGPFYTPREHSRLRLVPGYFVGSIRRMPRNVVYRSISLLLIAPLLVLMDFFL